MAFILRFRIHSFILLGTSCKSTIVRLCVKIIYGISATDVAQTPIICKYFRQAYARSTTSLAISEKFKSLK